MLKKLLRPIYFYFREKKELFLFQYLLKNKIKNKAPLKLVIGSSSIYQEGWLPTEAHFLNLLEQNDWLKYFKENTITSIVAEHVWEHLTKENGLIAMQTCFAFLKNNGGKLRIAVPDGFHADKSYIDTVKPNGTGAGAHDHKLLYNHKLMAEMLVSVGFKVDLIEYFDENGTFHQNNWSGDDGHIRRSFTHDERNKNGKPNYTSLIIDAVKA